MYVNVDEAGRIIAYNPNNLSGNTGWMKVKEKIGDPIVNEQGVALYKYKDGHAVSRTAEEIAEDTPEEVLPEPSEQDIIKQRLDEQDDALIELAALIGG